MNKLHILARSALFSCILLSLSGICTLRADAQISSGAPQVASQLPPPPSIMSVDDPRNPDHLTADQQKKAIGIEQTFESELKALQQNTSMTDDRKKAQFLQNQSAARQKYVALLTPAQKAIFDSRQKQSEAYMKGSRDSEAKGLALQKKLLASLTPAQNKKISALKSSGVTRIAAIEHNTKLTPLQQGRQEQQIAISVQAKIKTILTPQQSQMVADAYRYLSNANTLEQLARESGN